MFDLAFDFDSMVELDSTPDAEVGTAGIGLAVAAVGTVAQAADSAGMNGKAGCWPDAVNGKLAVACLSLAEALGEHNEHCCF